ncbi:MAG: efflux transporter outer membrane subunit [Acidobacteria bacterium]|nr:efflux transporter outer membrane subunit [Acidobacteriota bacterium]
MIARLRKRAVRPAAPLALLLFAFMSLGCASAGASARPPKLEIEAPVPSAWSTFPSQRVRAELPRPEQLGTEGLGVKTLAGTWWQAFGDSELDRLIELVLESNRDLRSAAARLDAALAQARIAGAARKPLATLSADDARRQQNFIGFPIPGSEDGVLTSTSTTLGASLNVSWEVDLWGRIRDGRLAAQAGAEAAVHDLDAARLSITGQTAKAWFGFLEAAGQAALAQETLANRTDVRKRIERRYRQGLRTALELRLAAANEANAEARHAVRKRRQDAIGRQLEVLLARNAEALQIIAGSTSALPALPPPAAPGLPGDVLRWRPDLRASERRLAAAGLNIAAARKLLYPRLTLTGSTGTTSREFDGFLNPDFSVWSLAAGLLQPLFQGGRLRAGVELSEAGHRDVLAQHENAVIRAVTEIEAQLANDAYLEEQQSAVTKAKQASSAAEALAQDRYFAGLSDYLSVLAAQDQAITAASRLLEVDRLRLEQRVDLFLALGGNGPSASAMATETEESK